MNVVSKTRRHKSTTWAAVSGLFGYEFDYSCEILLTLMSELMLRNRSHQSGFQVETGPIRQMEAS